MGVAIYALMEPLLGKGLNSHGYVSMGFVMGRQDYVTVKLPRDLLEEIDRVLGRFGYRSRTEFIKDAIRDLLRRYEPYVKTSEDKPRR